MLIRQKMLARAAIVGFALFATAGCASAVQPGTGIQSTVQETHASMMADPTSTPTTAMLEPALNPSPLPTLAPGPTIPTLVPTAIPSTNETSMTKNSPPVDKTALKKGPPLSSSTWINSEPLSEPDLRGKVVVVDFWTFACYNCKNTLPYLKAWDSKYRDQGLVIIGVHTPELSFERDVANVQQAVKDYGIEYPIAIDGDYANWNRYHVWAWPTWFILDKEGYIRYSHIGEGDYAQSEATIQKLLAE